MEVATPSTEDTADVTPLLIPSKAEFAAASACSNLSTIFMPACEICSRLELIWSAIENLAVKSGIFHHLLRKNGYKKRASLCEALFLYG
jgi:hypothetical protein